MQDALYAACRHGVAMSASAPWREHLERRTVRVGPGLPLDYYIPAEFPYDDDPEIIFLCGIVSDGRAWHRQTPLGRHYRLAFFDHPLEIPEAPYTFPILALLYRDAISQLCKRPPVLVGASFGGMLALTYSLEFPDALAGLVLVGTACDSSWFLWPFRLLHDLIDSVPTPLFGKAFPRLCALTGLADGQDAETCRLFFEEGAQFKSRHYARRIRAVGGLRLQNRLEEVRCPTLVMHGTKDFTIPVTSGIEMAQRIPGATLDILQNGGHSFYLSNPEWFNMHLMEWLAEVKPPDVPWRERSRAQR